MPIIRKYAAELLVGGLFLLAYFPILLWMFSRWFARDSYYSHGILVPFVAAFLIWQNRDELTKIQRVPDYRGLILIFIGLFVLVVSSTLRIYFSAAFSMPIVLVGLVMLFGGNSLLKALSFPLAFTLFMIPLPEVVITNISFNMKIFAAQIATHVLNNNLRMPAVREGSLIKMRSAYVMVDDVCSGLRSLISLTALGSVFAYWLKGAWWKRLLLFASTIPIAIITNVVRIIFLSAVSEIWGPQYASGFLHDLSGFLVFGLAFLLLFAVSKLIE